MSGLSASQFSFGVRLALSALLLALAFYDLRYKRLPNGIMQPAVLVAGLVLVTRLVAGGVGWMQLGIAAVTTTICLILWWFRAFGGGDMKLVVALIALFPDLGLAYILLVSVLLGALLALVTWDGRAGLRRLVALLAAAGQGTWPDRAEIAAAYRSRARPITFAFSLGATLYLWLVWSGWV